MSMAILSEFETKGVWRIATGILVAKWSDQPEFIPTDMDVIFDWNPEYNFSLTQKERNDFKSKYNISQIFEIVEIFGEPFSVLDHTFKGEQFLVARFNSDKDVVYFKMAMS
jgi:hypothetical protein